MGLSSSSTTQTQNNDPWAPAQPYILKGMQGVSDVFDQNQPMLQQMSSTAQNAFNSMAPGAFSNNPFVQGAQGTTAAIYGGATVDANPGKGTYGNVMNAGANPATGALSAAAGGDPTLAGLAASGGAASPSAQYYSDVLSGKYLNNNPYIDAVANAGSDAATKAVNARMAASGIGAGISTPYTDLLAKDVASAQNSVRYQNYNDQMNRMTQVGGQADSATNAANQIRLGAAQSDAQNKITAAQGLGSIYNQDLQTKLSAAQGADSSFNTQIAQALQAAAMAPALRESDYAGVSPALSLLNTAADIPYVGTAALNGQIRQASGGYGTSTSTQTTTPSLLSSAGGLVSLAGNIKGL